MTGRVDFLSRKPKASLRQPSNAVLPLDFHQGDALAALGMRGTGKTTLVKEMYKANMAAYSDICGYIIDSNAAGDFTGWAGGYIGYTPPIIHPGPKGRQVVWQPPKDDYAAYEDFFDRLFEATMRTGIGAVIMIDELSCLGHGDHRAYARLLKRGRLRHNFPGIGVYSISQEFAQKADVPRQTFSQMTHFVRFYVQHPYDVQESNKLLHLPAYAQPEHQHGFWAVRLDKPPIKPRYYSGLQEVFA